MCTVLPFVPTGAVCRIAVYESDQSPGQSELQNISTLPRFSGSTGDKSYPARLVLVSIPGGIDRVWFWRNILNVNSYLMDHVNVVFGVSDGLSCRYLPNVLRRTLPKVPG